MPLGDGIRRNIAHVEPSERAALRDAILELHQRFYPGAKTDTPPGGVSLWFKQDEIHQATHVHRGPEFVPWHREVVNHFEELIRQVNPQLSMHYWDFKEDPRNIPNGNVGGGAAGMVRLFDDPAHPFMGSSSGSAGDPLLAAGFYDPLAGTGGHPPDRDVTLNPVDPPNDIPRTRAPLAPGELPAPFTNAAQETALLAIPDFPTFRVALENMHNQAHPYFANVSPHDAFRDPFVYLLHSNMDRLFAMWQLNPAHPERLDPNTVYGSDSNHDVTVTEFGELHVQNLTHQVEPWSTGVGEFHNIRPWEPVHENQGFLHTYHDISVVTPPCYDTNPANFQIDQVQNPLNGITNRFQVVFNQVPEEETREVAATIRVYTCPDTTFRVKPGTEPGAPFGVSVGQVTAFGGAHPHLFQDVRIWFRFTAGPLGSAPQSLGPVNTTIRCDETGQEFPFELVANTLHRPTVAVQMVLDQSGSMADPAGTSGLTRLEVLKGAANLFATLIQNHNGLGIIRFDQNAYPPLDPTFPGMPITTITGDPDRNTAIAAINAHGAHGATSVGDGLVMGHNQLVAIPPGTYDDTAMLLLTDGIENQPVSILDAIGAGAVDSKVFAIGLGNEFQVNTGALNSITGSTGGNLLLSGILTPGTDDFFRVKKFFLQILAAVSKTSIVRDPIGNITSGQKIRIPFSLTEADIDCRVILLTDYPVVNLALATPDGNVINPANAAAFGVSFSPNGITRTASFHLPVSHGARVPAGQWYAILDVDPVLLKRQLVVLGDGHQSAAVALRNQGAKYCVSVHSFSNLRMTAAVTQTSHDPGSVITLRASLTEYSRPVEQRAAVTVRVDYPDHTQGSLKLAEIQPGVFEGTLPGTIPGIYRFLVEAKGGTSRGVPFTREQLLNAAIFREVTSGPGTSPPDDCIKKSDLCRLLTCLLNSQNLTPVYEETLKKEGINLAGIRKCIESFCKG